MDKHVNGLSSTLTNALKLIPGKGIGWCCYQYVCSSSVDLPKDNPILCSYAALLLNGYVCAWKKSVASEPAGGPLTSPLTPVNQGPPSGERMELWLFYSDQPPNLQELVSPQLALVNKGTWDEGGPPGNGVCPILFKALQNSIERSLVDRGFYPLGQWLAKPDPDSTERSCMMCKCSLFLHAHEVICASIDIKILTNVTTLNSELLSKAMVSKSGLPVLLSPSGLTASLTGHTYTLADESVHDIIEEWKLFYPKMVLPEFESDLPVAVEVVIGGVRMKYPSHGVLVLGSGEEDVDLTGVPKMYQWEESSGLLKKWCEHCKKESTDSCKTCNCKVAQKTVQQALGKGEKVSLSDIRLNPKRPKEEESVSCHALSFDPSDQPIAAKILKRDDMFDSSAVSGGIGSLAWSRGGGSGVPRYATPLPSPCVSLPTSPTAQQPSLHADHPSALLSAKSPLPSRYDPKSASGKLSVDVMSWNNTVLGWWGCLSLPVDTDGEQGSRSDEPPASRSKQSESSRSFLVVSKDRVSLSSELETKPQPFIGLPSPGEEPSHAPGDRHASGTERNFSNLPSEDPRRSLGAEMGLDSKLHFKDYTSNNLLNVPVSLDNIFDDDDPDGDFPGHHVPGQKEAQEGRRSGGGGGRDVLVDLHRMFPTPPSVEQPCVDEPVPEEPIEPIDSISSKDSWDSPVSDDEQQYIPMSFALLPDVPSKADLSPSCCYTMSTHGSTLGPASIAELTSARSERVHSTPQADKFLFPPLPSLLIGDSGHPKAKKRPEKLGLTQQPKTPISVNPVLSTPMHSPALRTSRHNSFYRHYSSRTTTPRDSPAVAGIELMTPTPAVLNKLLPALPEAHALYFTLHLTNCDPRQDLPDNQQTCQAVSVSGEDLTVSAHGFEEDVLESGGGGVASDWTTFGSEGVTKSGYVQLSSNYPDSRLPDISPSLLQNLQNLSFQTMFDNADVLGVGKHPSSSPPSSVYSEKVFVSTICQSQHLMIQQQKNQFSPYLGKPSNVVVPTNEGNAGDWQCSLYTVSNATTSKLVKDIKGFLDTYCFNVPSLHIKPEGPLSLKELQQLRSSQTILGYDCAPLPVPPILVGHEQELLSVSPLCMSAWEFMLFEPFSSRKDLVYIAIVPDQPKFCSSSQSFLKQVSITYETCCLGRHVPLCKNDMTGVVPVATESASTSATFVGNVKRCFRETIVPALKALGEDPQAELVSMYSTINPPPAYPLSASHQACPSIVLYLVITSHTQAKGLVQLLDAVDKILCNETVPLEVRNLLCFQVLNPYDIDGFFETSFSRQQVKKWAFNVYSCCREYHLNYRDVPSLTCFGPANDRKDRAKVLPIPKMFAPLFVLAPEGSTVQSGPLQHSSVGAEEEVLFLAYCVSSDKRWLLAASCDKHGELLNTAVIGIHPINNNNKYCHVKPRRLALQKLWDYCISTICDTLLRWSVVITRVGVPSWKELNDWREIINDDDLLTANNILKSQCVACLETDNFPVLISVAISSVQPESTFKLLPCQEYSTSFSHAIVLPPHPLNILHSPQEAGIEDMMGIFGGKGNMSDGIDDSFINFADFRDDKFFDEEDEPPSALAGDALNQPPMAKGYLVSPDHLSSSGLLRDCSSSGASILQVLLHQQFNDIRHDSNSSPQERLGSLLLYFDALAWLNVDPSSQLRSSCLPIHITLLNNLSRIMDLLLD